MRIRTLTLRHFQSHVESTVVFSTGLNVIIGSSNNGKSSIVRALRSLFYNDWSKSFTTVGQKSSDIEVELEDGTKILKTKGGGVNKISYTSNGKTEDFSGFGDNVPNEIIKLIGCGPIILDEDKKFFINIANQHDPIFLLNDSGSFKSKILGYISGIHILDGAIREIGSDLRSSQSNKTATETEIERLNAKISEFGVLETKKKRKDELEEILREQEQLRGKLNELSGLSAQIVAYNQQVEATKNKIDRLNSISEQKIHDDFIARMLDFGMCPVCGSTMDKEKLTLHTK